MSSRIHPCPPRLGRRASSRLYRDYEERTIPWRKFAVIPIYRETMTARGKC